jgi:cytochrome c biogenesis protein CcmG/thiol:disulfide interchange protein DsbE
MATHNDHLEVGAWTDARLAQLDHQDSWQPDTARAFARFQHDAKRRAHRGGQFALAGALVALTGGGLLAYPPAHQFAERCLAACVGQSNKLSAYLWGRTEATPGLPGRLIAEPSRLMAPGFSLPDRSGRAISLADHRGRVVLLNFWATWCSPCKREVPWLIDFQKAYASRGFTVLGLSLDEDGWTSVASYMDTEAINYPVAIATEEVVNHYGGVGAVPMTFLIDREGRVAASHVGLLNRDDVEAEIRGALAR